MHCIASVSKLLRQTYTRLTLVHLVDPNVHVRSAEHMAFDKLFYHHITCIIPTFLYKSGVYFENKSKTVAKM